MGNRFYIEIACRLGFEQMVDETEKLGSGWCHTNYGDWDDFFHSNLELAVPILNSAMQTELVADLIKHGISKADIKKLDISCCYYQTLDYIGVFTVKITSDKKTLGKLVDLISTCEVDRAMMPDPKDAGEPQELLPDFLQPCSLWDRANHRIPVWPVTIFEEPLRPNEP